LRFRVVKKKEHLSSNIALLSSKKAGLRRKAGFFW
jgi:hypothetical protein